MKILTACRMRPSNNQTSEASRLPFRADRVNVRAVSASFGAPRRNSKPRGFRGSLALALAHCTTICESFVFLRKLFGGATSCRSAGFQTCCIADFQVGGVLVVVRPAGLETRDTADLEVCATLVVASPRCAPAVVRCAGVDGIWSVNPSGSTSRALCAVRPASDRPGREFTWRSVAVL